MNENEPQAGGVVLPVTSAPTEDLPAGLLAPGQVLGERYEVRSQLGRGGMGEVWRAFDLKLRVEVALKVLLPGLYQDERRRDLLRREVRSAREVISPNVCRIFDLIEADGRELVSMEYVDGGTLLDLLHERGPLELKEAQDIASQFLAGLEEIHKAGLIHRDIKPENIMITRAGRVVLMDFGLARQEDSGAGSVSGTPAYMAPEQAAGLKVDARADVYSAGVVLAEMVSPAGIKTLESRQSIWEGIQSEPTQLPDSPWAPVLKKAVARQADQRYNSAHTLTRALEDVTLRVEGAEDLTPYPGLASFTEADAEYFFGREAEVEAMWARLEGPARLLGLVGPSGAGKTSFLRAGVIPAASPEWAVVRCTPGPEAMAALRQALVPALGGDTEALGALASGRDDATISACSRWRSRHGHALLIVDQFEELFTLNPADTQDRFAELLHKLPLETEVHVVLSMRDDFLMQCNRFESLRPVVADLMLLDPPTGANLRRALVQPATRCGYRFEDDELVDGMLAEVTGERGALPMLAFAAARLWEERDRESGLLTRRTYQDIGGVGGALAQHAESTLDRIGSSRVPVVRELFRNLVTADGTRAVREWDELLSVFGVSANAGTPERAGVNPAPTKVGVEGDRACGPPTVKSVGAGFTPSREAAQDVLRELVDARLLTTYEVHEEDGEPTRRVEIIHESLLGSWPRLERWLAQDAEGALLRDQLRQAAHTWDEHGRTDDLLWTGTAYREYRVWRERYPGGLSAVEESFGAAMIRHATHRRRRRRLAAAAILLVAVLVGAVTTTLWRRSAAETRRAEAGKLLALAQAALEDDTTAALAYARASLGLADTSEGRRFAVEVLWRGPVARILPVKQMVEEASLPQDMGPTSRPVLSPDGRWLASVGSLDGQIILFPSDGGPPRTLPRQPDGNVRVLGFAPRGDLLVTGGSGSSMRLWSLPELEEVRSVELGGIESWGGVGGGKLITFTRVDGETGGVQARIWPLPDGEPQVMESRAGRWWVNAGVTILAHSRGRTVLVSPVREVPGGSKRLVSVKERALGEATDLVEDLAVAPKGDRVASLDRSGEIRVWPTVEGNTGPTHVFQGPPRGAFSSIRFDPTGRYLSQTGPNSTVLLWDLDSPPGTEPRLLRRSVPGSGWGCTFDHDGRWAVTDFEGEVIEFWPLEPPWARTYRDVSSTIWEMAFTNDLHWLAVCPVSQAAQLWPLDAEHGAPRDLTPAEPCLSLVMHPAREEVLVGTTRGDVLLYPASGGPPRRLPGGFAGANLAAVAATFDPDGRRVIVGPSSISGTLGEQARALQVWDLDSGQQQVFSIAHLTDEQWLGWIPVVARDGSVYATLGSGDRLMRLVLPADTTGQISAETVFSAGLSVPTMSLDGRFLLVHASQNRFVTNFRFEQLLLYDLEAGTSRRITSHGTRLFSVSQVDPTGRILVTADIDGVVRVGPISGEEPHLLVGHQGNTTGLAISPDGRWIASADDASVRLWPMPDVTKPPLHTLPHDELLAKLDSFTNLRAVRDEASSTGWSLEVGPFPGWETVPSW